MFRRGHDSRPKNKTKPTLSKAATDWKHAGVAGFQMSPGTNKVTHKQNSFSYLAIYSLTCMSTTYWRYLFVCITLIEEKIYKGNIIEKYVWVLQKYFVWL